MMKTKGTVNDASLDAPTCRRTNLACMSRRGFSTVHGGVGTTAPPSSKAFFIRT